MIIQIELMRYWLNIYKFVPINEWLYVILFYLFVRSMQDKAVLNNFSAKISKAKIMHDSTTATCEKLKKEADQLER